jgi:DNA invertase Pin-like site-specific DNA recombinase
MDLGRAKKQGKQLGRPKRVFDRKRAKAMLQSVSAREVARQLGVSRGVIERMQT